MFRSPPRCPRTCTLVPYTPLVRSLLVRTDQRDRVQQAVEPRPVAYVARVHPKASEALAQLRHGGRVGAPVVVEDQDRLLARVPEVVEALEGHPAGERTVAEQRDHATALASLVQIGRAACRERGCQYV